jgi:hypothetical protein
MKVTWGVLNESLPLTEGKEGGLCLNREKSRSSGCSFRAFSFNRTKQTKLRSPVAVGCSLYVQG